MEVPILPPLKSETPSGQRSRQKPGAVPTPLNPITGIIPNPSAFQSSRNTSFARKTCPPFENPSYYVYT